MITNELEYNVEGKGSVEGSFTTVISGDAGFTAGYRYTADGGWDGWREHSRSFTFGRPPVRRHQVLGELRAHRRRGQQALRSRRPKDEG